MLKVRMLFVLFVFSFFSLIAQTDVSNNSLEKFFKIQLGSYSGLGISYEYPLNDKLLLDPYLGVGKEFQAGYSKNRGLFFDTGANFVTLGSELKYYYNRQKRQTKGKNMSNNAGNYIDVNLSYAYAFMNNAHANYLNSGLFWGIQRPLGNKFIYNVNLGLGSAYYVEATEFSNLNALVYFKIAYRL